MNAVTAEMQPLPLYGLAGSFVGDRWIEGKGQDQHTIIHRPAGMQKTLTVGVDRLMTSRNDRKTSGISTPANLSRLSMAMALVVDLPNVGNDVFVIAEQVARDDGAWRERKVRVDGHILTGFEREYNGAWIVYCLTATLIIYVLAPTMLRLDAVRLKTLQPSEVSKV